MFSVDFEKLADVLHQDVNSYGRLHLLRLHVSHLLDDGLQCRNFQFKVSYTASR